MAESEREPKPGQVPKNRLAAAIERVREDQANRDDVVIEMKQAARARLEMLAHDLLPVFKDLPADQEYFQFAMSNSSAPRLWIDLTTYVRMGRDPRSYEFVKDTRAGRHLLGDTADRETMAKQVTDYVAERLLERERIIEGEWQDMRASDVATVETERAHDQGSGGSYLLVFLLGLVVGAVAMVAWAWFDSRQRSDDYFHSSSEKAKTVL